MGGKSHLNWYLSYHRGNCNPRFKHFIWKGILLIVLSPNSKWRTYTNLTICISMQKGLKRFQFLIPKNTPIWNESWPEQIFFYKSEKEMQIYSDYICTSVLIYCTRLNSSRAWLSKIFLRNEITIKLTTQKLLFSLISKEVASNWEWLVVERVEYSLCFILIF